MPEPTRGVYAQGPGTKGFDRTIQVGRVKEAYCSATTSGLADLSGWSFRTWTNMWLTCSYVYAPVQGLRVSPSHEGREEHAVTKGHCIP